LVLFLPLRETTKTCHRTKLRAGEVSPTRIGEEEEVRREMERKEK
jgi:hypothetical protein